MQFKVAPGGKVLAHPEQLSALGQGSQIELACSRGKISRTAQGNWERIRKGAEGLQGRTDTPGGFLPRERERHLVARP
jgi:hypothetical protein